jgi:hypothetical protein
MTTRRKLSFLLLMLLGILLVTEIALRIWFHFSGYTVGSLAPNWQPVREVAALQVTPSFSVDSSGVFVANKAYWQSKGIAINSNGFRGGEFTRDSTSKKPSLLLIGDSFTWGAEAQPLDSSFADRLKQHYQVFNAGIPGADPAQYALIAQQLLFTLKPNYVAVMFYTGNDIMDTIRQPQPYGNLYYVTNTGWLPGWYKGRYFKSAEEAYNFYKELYIPKSTLEKLACKTAIGTLALSVPLRLDERQQWQRRKQHDVSNQYLFQVFWMCEQAGLKPLIFVIPNGAEDLREEFRNNPKQYIGSQYPATFKNLQNITYVIPATKKDYLPMPNGHFNNRGHAAAAAYIDSVISAYP